jgi:Rrf2 family protein
MLLLPRKGVLAIAAVLDIAMNSRGRPVAAKSLAGRHRLPSRHLEPVLQALVRKGILRGVRGPRGGYELARAENAIAVDEILRAAGTVTDEDDAPPTGSSLLTDVVVPALARAEETLAAALARITIADLTQSAEGCQKTSRDPRPSMAI